MPNLRKVAELGKAALTVASLLMVPGPLAVGMAVAGETADSLISNVRWDGEGDNRIAEAVEGALRKVKRDVPPGAQRIVDELIASVDSPLALDERIRQTESYLSQCETPQTQRLIAEKFRECFREEMRRYPDLQILISISDGLSAAFGSLEQRMRDHDAALCSQEQMINAIKAELDRVKRAPLLCLPGATPGVKLIGRDQDLEVFTPEADAHGKICVVSGIGGVGKTEFIKAYMEARKDTLGRVGWFEYRDSFRETLLATPGLVFQSGAPAGDPQARYNEIMSLLRQLNAGDLMVFDNVGRVESAADMDAILALPCRMIFTTRETFEEDINRLLVYDMDFLSEEACEALFAHYRCQGTPEAERASLLEVIRLAGRHTLALELMAKTCKAAGLAVGELLERLNRDGFNLAGLREEVRREGGRDSKRFLQHMLKLYDIADVKAMGEEAEWLLANLSVLPLRDFDIKVLVRWLELPDRAMLNRLNDRGWIRIGRGDTVTMHSVIAEVVRAALKPDSDRCAKLMEAIRESIAYSQADVRIYQAPYLRCAESAVKYVAGETKGVADLCAQVGFVKYMQGEYSGALLNYCKALATFEKVLGEEHPDTAVIYNNLGIMYQVKGDYDNALKYQLKALVIHDTGLGVEDLDTGATHNSLGILYNAKGDYDNALKHHLQAMTTLETVFGGEHPNTATAYNNLGILYQGKGDYENALKYQLHALSVREKVLGREHPDTAISFNNLGILYQVKGEYDNALKYQMQAMSISEKVLGREHPVTATTYNNMASLYQDQGDYGDALRYHLRALAIREKVLGREHPDTAITYGNLAGLFIQMGEKEKAAQCAENAYAVFLAKLGEEHKNTQIAKERLNEVRKQ